jgi:ABC-type proline/glycine betaine transport system substrate-binding protein
MKRWIVAAAGLCLSLAVAAQAPLRTIPADTKRGKLAAIEMGAVKIDGQVFRMAPGARILSASNLTVTPNQVVSDTLVRYQTDGQGQIRTIWILTPEEAKRR